MLITNKASGNAKRAAQIPSETASRKADITPSGGRASHKRGKKRVRRRGEKKLDIPLFECLSVLDKFYHDQQAVAIEARRLLTSIKTTDSGDEGKRLKDAKRFGKKVERKNRALWTQVEILQRRLVHARSLQRIWCTLALQLYKDLAERECWHDEDVWEWAWMLRKKRPLPSRFHLDPTMPSRVQPDLTVSALQQEYGVYTREDLSYFNYCWLVKMDRCVNGWSNRTIEAIQPNGTERGYLKGPFLRTNPGDIEPELPIGIV